MLKSFPQSTQNIRMNQCNYVCNHKAAAKIETNSDAEDNKLTSFAIIASEIMRTDADRTSISGTAVSVVLAGGCADSCRENETSKVQNLS